MRMKVVHLELNGHSEEQCCDAVHESLKNEDFETFYIGGTGRDTEQRSRDGDHVKNRGNFFTIKASNDMMESLKLEEYLICNLFFDGKTKTNKNRRALSYTTKNLRWEVYIKLMKTDTVHIDEENSMDIPDAMRLWRMGVVVKQKNYTCHAIPDKEYHPMSEQGKMYILTHCIRVQKHKFARSWKELLEYEDALCHINTMQVIEKVVSMKAGGNTTQLSRQERLLAMNVDQVQKNFKSHATPHKFYHPKTETGRQFLLLNSTRKQALNHARAWKELLQFEDGLISIHRNYLNSHVPL